VSVLALRNVSMKRCWVDTGGENPKYSASSLAKRHVFCHRTHIGWAGRDPEPGVDETLLLDCPFDIIHISVECLFVVYLFPLLDSAIGLFRPQNLRRVLGLETSCLFLDAIDKLMILYHTLSLHVLHACVIFSVIRSMYNSLAFISCQDKYIL